jgi:hypothetical protein
LTRRHYTKSIRLDQQNRALLDQFIRVHLRPFAAHAYNLAMDNSMHRTSRHRIRISVLLLAAFGASLPLLAADETILPHGWDPSVTDAVDYLKSELETEQAQQGINRLTGHISSLLDAELFVTYVRLFEHLVPSEPLASHSLPVN